MQRIIKSTLLIAAVAGMIGIGGTGAFFSDTESSTANVFTAGAIDLKVDNESYYNGVLNASTTWTVRDLTIEKFFDFPDLKPDDYGEDTISLHVDTNDAYLCANVTVTSNNENGQTEPEALVDLTTGASEGELANLVNFLWWADDGDNVLENDEDVIAQGPIGTLGLNTPYPIALADSDENIWTGVGGPVPGLTTKYIGKAWCFGTLGTAPVAQDGTSTIMSPAGNNGGTAASGEPEDGGLTCDGTLLGNESQTDSLTADVTFTAVQARHNSTFQCEEPRPLSASLTLVKNVVNDDVGTALPTAWTLSATGPGATNPSGTTGSGAVTNAQVVPGTYTLSESGGPIGYAASQWSCVKNGGTAVLGNSITLANNDIATCTITNDDLDTVACTPTVSFADAVVSSDNGVRKDGSAILVDRTDPTDALNAPQSLGTPFDNPVVAGSFFSLGFDEGIDGTPAEGGKIVLSFNDNYIIDGPGNDIRAWEVTGGTSYPTEMVKVEVSQDGSTWYTAAPALLRDEEADMSNTPLDWAKYVRLTDVSNRADAGYPADADGYDLDAVSALNCAQLPLQN